MKLMFVFGFKKILTCKALVCLVHAVNGAHMRLQMGQLREPGVGADGTAEWFFSGVFSYVQLENARVCKGLPADLHTYYQKYVLLI